MRVGVDAAPLLARLHALCFPDGERWDEAAMRTLLSMPGCFGWIETGPDDTPCGLALARVAVDDAELLTIGVVPEQRGQRRGERILRSVGDLAAGQGAGRLILEVASRNPAALALYRRCGFTRIGTRRRYYPDGDDAVVLETGLSGTATDRAISAG